jgi:hypothetical protein
MAFHGQVTGNHKKENSQCEEGGAGGKQVKKQTCRRTHRRVSIQRFDAECDWQVNVTGKKESELVSTHLFRPPFFFLFLLIQKTSSYVSSPSLLRFIFFGRFSETWSRGKTTAPVPKAEKPIPDPKNKKKKEREEKGGVGDAKKNRLFSSAAEYQIIY